MTKLVTIVGATGSQGKGVVAAFINHPAYHVRAITRNLESQSAKALSAQGVELVRADLNDPQSVKAAFAGSNIIFAVTNFMEPFEVHQSPVKAVETELQQGINMAEAAASTIDTLEHYIWSTLPDSLAISRGKHAVPHFNGKNKIDEHIRSLPVLEAKTTFLWITWYHNNYIFPIFTPLYVSTAQKYIQLGPYQAETPVWTLGDVTKNITPFIRGIIASGDKAKGEIVVAHTEETTMGELLQTWAGTKGAKAQLIQIGGKEYRELWGLWGEEMATMMEFWSDVKDKSWTDAEGRKVLTRKDLGIEVGEFETLVKGFENLQF
ncbi:hypothetical protein QBC35DRAFT_32748 [Podospora australis]|uniref:NmrA-like domain-containing protein n=1 Tax=Podospora australis TaxID=1536484 RepID=A0AAN6WNB3_9PEZI|nr:hypothetical protein QBC35DRAFT_32748 [Podospora australis]